MKKPKGENLHKIFGIEVVSKPSIKFKVKAGRRIQTQEKRHDSKDTFAVNLSLLSLREGPFMDWLVQTLKNVPQYAGRMIFESFEYPCVTLLESFRSSIDGILDAGSSFAFDHFGVGSSSFGYLVDLKLAYLEIDGSYIRLISENRDHQFFVQAITNIAHGLDIRIIACHVENRQDYDAVKMLGADGIQGKFVEWQRQ